MKVYSPSVGDGRYMTPNAEGSLEIDCTEGCAVDGDTICWWHMACGRVLGIYDNRLIEYDPSTLAPWDWWWGGMSCPATAWWLCPPALSHARSILTARCLV